MTTGHLKNYFRIAYEVEGSGCQTNTLRCRGKEERLGAWGHPGWLGLFVVLKGDFVILIAYLIFLCVERNDDFGPQAPCFATRNAKLLVTPESRL